MSSLPEGFQLVNQGTIGSFSDPESSEDEFPPEELVDEGPNTGFVERGPQDLHVATAHSNDKKDKEDKKEKKDKEDKEDKKDNKDKKDKPNEAPKKTTIKPPASASNPNSSLAEKLKKQS